MKKTVPAPLSTRATMRRGRQTIPKAIREAAALPAEATFVVQPVGEGLLLVSEEMAEFLRANDPGDLTTESVLQGADPAARARAERFLAAAREFRRICDAAGVTLSDLLGGLRKQRRRYTEEVYGWK